MKFFLWFVFFVLSFYLYVSRFRNPNKLYFLFGKKGSGKSTYMVKLMLYYMRKGWHIYTNMTDVNIDGVRIFSVPDLITMTPDKHSVVFIDEGTTDFDNRNYKNFSAGYQDWFKYQRKYGCRVYINSQSYDIDKKLRGLTDEMQLCNNLFGVICLVRPIVKSVRLTEPLGDSESRVAEGLRFAPFWRCKVIWLPRYFKYFDSFSAPPRPSLRFDLVDNASALSVLRRLQS